MSQVLTTTVRQKQTIMVRSPMQVDAPDEASSSRSTAPTTPEHQQPAADTATTAKQADSSRNVSEDAAYLRQKAGDLKINTDANAEGDAGDEAICVCTPAQKVPRPPNSFILYRSRMQSRIAAENPGLSNPQISQILGERWSKETVEEKAKWRTLAHEESRRHREQYPDYKYQPRRRGSKALTHTPDDETGRCPKCNGRFMSRTPQTPALPVTPGKESTTAQTQQPSPNSDDAQRARPSTTSGSGSSMSLRRYEDRNQGSPDSKRRRLMTAAESRAVPPIQVATYGHRQQQQGYSATTPSSGGSYTTGRQHVATPLPFPGAMSYGRTHGGPMPPPPRPPVGPGGGWNAPPYQYPRRDSIAEESLRLPPLQTAISPARDYDMKYGPTPTTAGGPMMSAKDSPSKSATEHILSIPYTRKMSVLGKICPRLPRHDLGTPGPDTRGPIIVVEGHEDDLLTEVGKAVEKALLVAPEDIALKTWTNEIASDIPPIPKEGDRGDDSHSSAELQDLLPSIFKGILAWHEKSKDMTRHVQGTDRPKSEDRDSNGDEAPSASRALSTPAALVMGGFSLTTSDRYACSTSQSVSNYSSVDHWQWMATLWRGIVGPDLVVYIKTATEDEARKVRTVDFQERLGAIVVTVVPEKGLDEATERRLAFEVIEWMRSGWIRDGRPRSG